MSYISVCFNLAGNHIIKQMKFRDIYESVVFMVGEFVLFYVFIPFITINYFQGWLKVLVLLGIAMLFLTFLFSDPSFDKSVFFRLDKTSLKRSLPRVISISVLLIWFTWWVFPDLFFIYPLQDFRGYMLTLILYPLMSVVPQEIIYRAYFFHRYRKLVPEKYLLMLSNAIIFGLTHLIYGNWVAPIATFLISWIFIFNYLKTQSVINVSLEHYMYGLVMFTVGFGYYFQ